VKSPLQRVVLNEWIFHDLLGENGTVTQRTAAETLVALIEQPFCLSFMESSPWAAKAYGIMTSGDPLVRKLSRLLHTRLLLDPSKCVRVDRTDELPDRREVVDRAPRKDRYLVITYLLSGSQELVTADQPLITAYEGRRELRVTHRVDFAWRLAGLERRP